MSLGSDDLIPIYQDSTYILWKLETWLLMSCYCVDSKILCHPWKRFQSYAPFQCWMILINKYGYKVIHSLINHTSKLLSLYKDAYHHQCEQQKELMDECKTHSGVLITETQFVIYAGKYQLWQSVPYAPIRVHTKIRLAHFISTLMSMWPSDALWRHCH